jgi:hypothetical protein
MAYRGLGMVEVREIVRRWLASDSIRAIARATGMDRKTRSLSRPRDQSSRISPATERGRPQGNDRQHKQQGDQRDHHEPSASRGRYRLPRGGGEERAASGEVGSHLLTWSNPLAWRFERSLDAITGSRDRGSCRSSEGLRPTRAR